MSGMGEELRYNDYAAYLKSKYGSRVYRIGLDAGFSCPNRDGTKGYGGCSFCGNNGSRSSYTNPKDSIKRQVSSRIEYLKKTKSASKFIAYFQAFTNTHANVDILKRAYDQVIVFDRIVGISIGTRPDAIDREKIGLIASYMDKYEVWIEFGLQSIHNRTLELMNRRHTFEDFLSALELSGEFGVPVCAHVILGLPGESRDDMIETARKISILKIGAVKIHLLHILKDSPIEKLYGAGKIDLLNQDEYAGLVCDFLENLSPDIIIQRVTGEGSRSNHVAPEWAMDKIGTINKIRDLLCRRGTRQGSGLVSGVRS